MAKKRKHDEVSKESSGGKEKEKVPQKKAKAKAKAKDAALSQVASSNWMQLQAVGVADLSRCDPSHSSSINQRSSLTMLLRICNQLCLSLI